MPKKDNYTKINIRLQKYKKNRILGMSQYNAAIAAGYAKTTAHAKGRELEERAKISDVMERQGLTDKVLIQKLMELIEAKDVVLKKNLKGELEVVGNIENYFPNWSARGKGLDLALRLKDLLIEKHEHSGEIKVVKMNDIKIQNRLLEFNIGQSN